MVEEGQDERKASLTASQVPRYTFGDFLEGRTRPGESLLVARILRGSMVSGQEY